MDYRISDFLDEVDLQVEHLTRRAGVCAPRCVWLRNEGQIDAFRRMDMCALLEHVEDEGMLIPYSRGLDHGGAIYGMYVGIIADDDSGALDVSLVLARNRQGSDKTEIWDGGAWKRQIDGAELIVSLSFLYEPDMYDPGDWQPVDDDDDEELPFGQSNDHVIYVDFSYFV